MFLYYDTDWMDEDCESQLGQRLQSSHTSLENAFAASPYTDMFKTIRGGGPGSVIWWQLENGNWSGDVTLSGSDRVYESAVRIICDNIAPVQDTFHEGLGNLLDALNK